MHGGVNHGKALMTAPYPNNPALRLWEGSLDKKELDKLMLVRNVGVTSAGRLEKTSLALAAKLSIPHNFTPVVDNNSDIPKELTPQVYFQYTYMDVCDCSQCSEILTQTHKLPAG